MTVILDTNKVSVVTHPDLIEKILASIGHVVVSAKNGTSVLVGYEDPINATNSLFLHEEDYSGGFWENVL